MHTFFHVVPINSFFPNLIKTFREETDEKVKSVIKIVLTELEAEFELQECLEAETELKNKTKFTWEEKTVYIKDLSCFDDLIIFKSKNHYFLSCPKFRLYIADPHSLPLLLLEFEKSILYFSRYLLLSEDQIFFAEEEVVKAAQKHLQFQSNGQELEQLIRQKYE